MRETGARAVRLVKHVEEYFLGWPWKRMEKQTCAAQRFWRHDPGPHRWRQQGGEKRAHHVLCMFDVNNNASTCFKFQNSWFEHSRLTFNLQLVEYEIFLAGRGWAESRMTIWWGTKHGSIKFVQIINILYIVSRRQSSIYAMWSRYEVCCLPRPQNRARKCLCNLRTLKLPFPTLNRQTKGSFRNY